MNNYLFEHNWTIKALEAALHCKDSNTKGHSSRLIGLTAVLGKKLDLSLKEINDLNLFAHFHDLGKVLISDALLFKEAPLTEEEWQIMRGHSEIGACIASSIIELRHLPDYILKHHERWDGSGYPGGISGEEIPLFCRILSIADAFDAMTNNRPYRAAMSFKEATRELQINAGSQFDPYLIQKFEGLNFLCP